MNTLKKIGLTALGTSLVAGSAYAGEITASGDAGYTWSSEEVGVRTDEGYGFNHDITFSGSGELDNGFTVSTTMILVESSALSSSNVTLGMGGLGSITIGNGWVGVGRNYDDCAPVKGVFRGNEKQFMDVRVQLDTRNRESPPRSPHLVLTSCPSSSSASAHASTTCTLPSSSSSAGSPTQAHSASPLKPPSFFLVRPHSSS